MKQTIQRTATTSVSFDCTLHLENIYLYIYMYLYIYIYIVDLTSGLPGMQDLLSHCWEGIGWVATKRSSTFSRPRICNIPERNRSQESQLPTNVFHSALSNRHIRKGHHHRNRHARLQSGLAQRETLCLGLGVQGRCAYGWLSKLWSLLGPYYKTAPII